ncbi:hypothetical protein BN874_900006 [Candidatus Contendobacter odensis Run_B_J11]|uniref:Uncharacterized protein n=1 Tax=Candidatus Contendobacter odensis Run_B_J11 TaxID=1400861 RepID=A0A7U7GG93_9GAMM|nr:hypothetical protein BN874_900006 [Candidatus Contendobacter odensis Run_B_J11]
MLNWRSGFWRLNGFRLNIRSSQPDSQAGCAPRFCQGLNLMRSLNRGMRRIPLNDAVLRFQLLARADDPQRALALLERLDQPASR